MDADLDYIRGDMPIGSDLTEGKVEAPSDPQTSSQNSETNPAQQAKAKFKMDTPRPNEFLEALQHSKKDDTEKDEEPQKPEEHKGEKQNVADTNGDVVMEGVKEEGVGNAMEVDTSPADKASHFGAES